MVIQPYFCVIVCWYHEDQKRALDALERESQAVVSHTAWALGTKLQPCKGALLATELSLEHHLGCSLKDGCSAGRGGARL